MDQTAVTYPYVTVNEMTGEDDQDDPRGRRRQPVQPGSVLSQGGDMVRVGGLRYAIDPLAKMGARITSMELAGKPLDAAEEVQGRRMAPVSEEARAAGGAAGVGRRCAQPSRAGRRSSRAPSTCPKSPASPATRVGVRSNLGQRPASLPARLAIVTHG